MTRVNLTATKVFRLEPRQYHEGIHLKQRTHLVECAGVVARHNVCSLISFNGPGTAFGVREGSQKSGSLARRASACSLSIFFSAAASASRASDSARSWSKVNSSLRFVPRATRISQSKPHRTRVQTYDLKLANSRPPTTPPFRSHEHHSPNQVATSRNPSTPSPSRSL